jgi:Bacterial SH3 domain
LQEFKETTVKRILALLTVTLFLVIILAGCTTIKDWTRKTTNWEIGMAQSVLGKDDDKKTEEPKDDDEEDDADEKANSDDHDDGGIVGWTKRTTEWEMREADKVITDKKTKSSNSDDHPGGTCRIKDGCSTANVRSGPSTKNPVIAKLKGGDSVNVVEVKSGWVRIRLDNGGNGWVYGDLVEHP